MKNSKTLEFMNNLNEKINKDNIEINKAIANPNLGKNQDRIKQAGYDIEYDGDYIKNPKTGKGVWPKDYNRDEKKKVDFKGKLDSERPTMSKTTRYDFDVKDNKIPKSAKIGKNAGYGTYNSDEIESYSPLYRDAGKKSISTNVNTYKRAVADKAEKTKNAAYYDNEAKRDEDKIKEIEKDKERHQKSADFARKEADFAEQKRKELIDKVRAKKTSTVKEGAKPLAKELKKIIKEAEEDNPLEGKDIFYVFEDFDTGVDENQEKLIKYVNEDLKLGLDPIKDDLKIALEIQKMTGEQVIRLIHMCYGDEIGNKFEEYLDTRLEAGLNTNKIKYIKIKESKLTEARQEEILSKLPKKKIEETDDTINESEENGPKVNEEGIKKELNEVSSAQAEFLYNQRKRKEYEKEQNEIRRADKISMLQTMINGLREHLWDLGLRYLPGNTVHKIYTKDDNKLYDSCTISESDLIEKLTKLEKFLRDAIDKRKAEIGNVNESEKQTLNEETVGEKITSPSGKFYVGDPCYVLSDDIYYGIWDDKYNFEDGIIDCGNGLSFLVHGTAYGDGSYQGTNGTEYGVDSGTLAVIPMDLVAKLDGVQFGSVEASKTAWLDYNDGTFDITLDNGSFSIITSEDEEEEDGPWDPEEYDEGHENDWDDDYYRPGDDLDESEKLNNIKDIYDKLSDNLKNYLENTDNVPTKEIDGTLWFNITAEEKEQLEKFIKYIDTIPENVWKNWDEKTKLDVSSYVNNADRICRNCTLIK